LWLQLSIHSGAQPIQYEADLHQKGPTCNDLASRLQW
jgi:hypothetical protein